MNCIFRTIQIPLLLLGGFFLSSCAIQLEDCAGPLLNTQNLLAIQANRFFEGPQAYLVLPNPIDSPQLKLFDISQLNESNFRSAQLGVGLPELQNFSALENSFLKVRLNSIGDSPDKLVRVSELSAASTDVKDPKYSQVMAYHGITAITDYVESLGFSVDRSRELYVMVRSYPNPDPEPNTPPQEPSKEMNAYYVHNTYSKKPRYIQLFGDLKYPLGADRDVFWHEFGHLFNESITANRGIDDASERGAIFMEGGAIHECIADYLSESASNKPYIGKWAARNTDHIPLGQPLRSAVALSDDKNRFSSVNTFKTGANGSQMSSQWRRRSIPVDLGLPEKYDLAEWCSRVLWDIRSQFEKEHKKTGKLFSDRTIFSAVSLLGKNASISQFKEALLNSDQQLHCGLHQKSIQKAFSSRGFQDQVPQLPQKLNLQAQWVAFQLDSTRIVPVAPSARATEILASFRISNPNNRLARNVRLELMSNDPAIITYANVQGFGDLPPGAAIEITGTDYSQYLASVSFAVDPRYINGRRSVKVVLKLSAENGVPTLLPLEVPL